MRKILIAVLAAVMLLAAGGCNTIDDNRIPAMPVNINLSTPDLWVTYGPSGYGDYRLFIRELREPRNFAFTEKTATGYGGVLVICGVNPFFPEQGIVPLAYDLSCPVESKPEIRVEMQADGLVPIAVCPECGSSFDVVERGGSPIEGIALSENVGLSRYECRPTQYGGYLIIN